jgi:hypothetical protein
LEKKEGGSMSKQFKVYGDVVQEYYILITADSRDEAWYAAEATPKEGWQKLPDRNEGNAIEPYNIEELD